MTNYAPRTLPLPRPHISQANTYDNARCLKYHSFRSQPATAPQKCCRCSSTLVRLLGAHPMSVRGRQAATPAPAMIISYINGSAKPLLCAESRSLGTCKKVRTSRSAGKAFRWFLRHSCGERPRAVRGGSVLPSLLHSNPPFRAHIHRECARKAQLVGASPDMPRRQPTPRRLQTQKKVRTF